MLHIDELAIALCEQTGGHVVDESRDDSMTLYVCVRCGLTDDFFEKRNAPVYYKLRNAFINAQHR